MKLFRRTSALVMAMVLVLSLSLTALAADFDNMTDGFNYDGEDTEVNINLKTDDEFGFYESKEGKTYNISSDNGSMLSYAGFGGSGSVEVNVDTGYIGAEDSVTVTINGDVNDEVSAREQAEVTVNGDVNGIVNASEQSEVTVNGDVNGSDGNPDDVDYTNPYDYSDAGDAVVASGDATVTVTGDVTGGDAYGTYAYAGDGILAFENATVTVGGDVTGGSVTADPNTEASVDEYGILCNSTAGVAVTVGGGATVSVGGNVTGGSTNGDQGVAGNGVAIGSDVLGTPAGTVSVAGAVTAGKAENGTDGIGIRIGTYEGEDQPSITVGSYDTAAGVVIDPETGESREMTEEDFDSIITITSEEEPGEIVSPGKVFYDGWDSHYGYLMQLIRVAKEGDEITTNIGARHNIPAEIINAARDKGITLIIQWSGGEDLVITKDFTEELHGYVLITDLADMLKK